MGTNEIRCACDSCRVIQECDSNNSNRLRTKLVLQQRVGTWTNAFTYDFANRLKTVASAAGTFTYNYEQQRITEVLGKLGSKPQLQFIRL